VDIGRTLSNDGLHLVRLFEMAPMANNNYYGAVMFSDFGPGHYMAYCGTSNQDTVFFGVDSTTEAQVLADSILSDPLVEEIWRDIGGHGITYSDSRLLDDILLGAWWIGTDFQVSNGSQGGSIETAMRSCEGLRSLLWRSTTPHYTADAIIGLRDYRKLVNSF